MVTSGAGWRLAGSLIQLGHEIAAVFPQATCLGTLGDAAHRSEGGASDHNPIVTHGGLGIVRAIDIGGPDSMLKEIRQRVWTLYAEEDPRLWMYGYSKGCSDNLVNNFGLPFKTHIDTGDAGHLHVSVTQSHYPSIPSGYLPAIDSTAPWGISGAVFSGGGSLLPVESDVDATTTINTYVGAGKNAVEPYLQWTADARGVLQEEIQAVGAQVSKMQTPVIDYTQLAAALIAQLKAV